MEFFLDTEWIGRLWLNLYASGYDPILSPASNVGNLKLAKISFSHSIGETTEGERNLLVQTGLVL